MTTTTIRQPIAKLYKRCAWKHHADCPGSFESWSICSCKCHAPIDATAAIAEAESIIYLPAPKTEPIAEPAGFNVGKRGSTLRERAFLPCPEHAPNDGVDIDELVSTSRTLRMVIADNCKSCAACNALTLENARAYARYEGSRPQPSTFSNGTHFYPANYRLPRPQHDQKPSQEMANAIAWGTLIIGEPQYAAAAA